MVTIPVEVNIFRCDETQQAAALFALPQDPLLFLLGTTDLAMLLQENSAFDGLVSSFQNRTITQLAQYGTAEELEAVVRGVLAGPSLTTWNVLSVSSLNVDPAELQRELLLTNG